MLWTRVQGGVTKALSGTTLADLVDFADQHASGGEGRQPGSRRKSAVAGAA
jgi:hypothetical protein